MGTPLFIVERCIAALGRLGQAMKKKKMCVAVRTRQFVLGNTKDGPMAE